MDRALEPRSDRDADRVARSDQPHHRPLQPDSGFPSRRRAHLSYPTPEGDRRPPQVHARRRRHRPVHRLDFHRGRHRDDLRRAGSGVRNGAWERALARAHRLVPARGRDAYVDAPRARRHVRRGDGRTGDAPDLWRAARPLRRRARPRAPHSGRRPRAPRRRRGRRAARARVDCRRASRPARSLGVDARGRDHARGREPERHVAARAAHRRVRISSRDATSGSSRSSTRARSSGCYAGRTSRVGSSSRGGLPQGGATIARRRARTSDTTVRWTRAGTLRTRSDARDARVRARVSATFARVASRSLRDAPRPMTDSRDDIYSEPDADVDTLRTLGRSRRWPGFGRAHRRRPAPSAEGPGAPGLHRALRAPADRPADQRPPALLRAPLPHAHCQTRSPRRCSTIRPALALGAGHGDRHPDARHPARAGRHGGGARGGRREDVPARGGPRIGHEWDVESVPRGARSRPSGSPSRSRSIPTARGRTSRTR